MRDQADWDGISLNSVDVGARRDAKGHQHNGYYYANVYEKRLAELLHRQGVPFTPDVRFSMYASNGRTVHYVADFVFNKDAYLWTANGHACFIHGFEAKGMSNTGTFSDKAVKKMQRLYEQRGIMIPLISNAEIDAYWRAGQLPLIHRT